MPKPPRKLPKTVWLIADDITEELWCGEGWHMTPCDSLVFTSRKRVSQEVKKIQRGPCRRLCLIVLEVDTKSEQITHKYNGGYELGNN